METSVFSIKLNNGSEYRIFCANATQKKKVIRHYNRIKDRVKEFGTITNGIHTVKQFEKILTQL